MFQPSKIHQALLLFAMVLAVSVVLLGTTILNVALPAMQEALNASNTDVQWILNAYTLTFAGFLLLSGTIGDRFGYRRVLLAALVLFALTAAIGSIARGTILLIVMRAIMGLAAAGIMPITLAVLNRSVPEADRPATITVWAAFSGLAIALGPLIGGALLTAGLWWGSVLALVALLAVIAILATILFVPDVSDTGAGELRVMPALGSVVGVALLVWGVLNGGEHGQWLSGWVAAPLLVGAVVLAWLAFTEARHEQPMADVRLFANGLFTVSTLVLTLGTFVVYGFLYFTTYYLELARGFSPFETGLALIPLPIGLLFSAPISRWLVVRLGPQAVMAIGMLITAAGLGLLALLDTNSSIYWFALITFAVISGFGLVLSPGTAAAMSAVPLARAGAGSALLNTMRQIGSALGIAILGSLLWASYQHSIMPHLGMLPTDSKGDVARSLANTLAVANAHPSLVTAGQNAFDHAMHVTTLIAAAICLPGGLAALMTIRGRSHNRATQSTASSY